LGEAFPVVACLRWAARLVEAFWAVGLSVADRVAEDLVVEDLPFLQEEVVSEAAHLLAAGRLEAAPSVAAQLAAREYLTIISSTTTHAYSDQSVARTSTQASSRQHSLKPHLRVEVREQAATCLEAALGEEAVHPVVLLEEVARQEEDLEEVGLLGPLHLGPLHLQAGL
jgi:hypothetical protein